MNFEQTFEIYTEKNIFALTIIHLERNGESSFKSRTAVKYVPLDELLLNNFNDK